MQRPDTAAFNAIRTEATELLDATGLRATLEHYGQLTAHGSYGLDLMVWRDLDIYLCPPNDELHTGRFFQLGADIAQLLHPHRMHFRDETRVQTAGLPAGLYWGLHLASGAFAGWKVDIWAITSAELRRLSEYQTWVAAHLTPERRAIVLEIKASVHAHPQYRRAFSAKDVYDAVLVANVETVQGFWAYIGDQAV